ncbi:MFS transporter [Chryseobacterium sp. T16E-39]|uniref:MFS transporter n=1 Tax=Chryseobacterium sp. T16E-39 TaxID=2015076 RepID=UPI000B5B2D20|nr:MFS transporter [Chryseobacterium sp. T16E-39]ASK32556.1 MFS transporter [Chryseobacterium sp. T16E-39]
MIDHHWKRKFAFLWTGQFFSLISSSAVGFAIIIWLSLKTGSAEVLAYAAIAGLLPQALIGPFAGVYVDRWDRKKTMIFADGFVALCTLVMSISFYSGYENLQLVYIILGLRSVGSAFHMPAMQATIPLLAPKSELLRIAGINQIIKSVSNIAGPALGALAIGLLSIGNVLLLDIGGAVLAISSLLFISIPSPQKESDKQSNVLRVWKDMESGLKEVIRNKGLTFLFLYSIIAGFCIMPISVLFPLMTIEHFHGGKFEMSIVETVWGVGALIGGGILGIWKFSIHKVVIVNLSHILIGIAFLWSGLLSPGSFVFFVLLTGLGGVAASFYSAGFTAIVQEEVQPGHLGRVFSMYFSIEVLPTVIGLVCTGFVADSIGVNSTFVILGSVIFVVGIVSFMTPSLMRLKK